jgi:hypothetical protein
MFCFVLIISLLLLKTKTSLQKFTKNVNRSLNIFKIVLNIVEQWRFLLVEYLAGNLMGRSSRLTLCTNFLLLEKLGGAENSTEKQAHITHIIQNKSCPLDKTVFATGTNLVCDIQSG